MEHLTSGQCLIKIKNVFFSPQEDDSLDQSSPRPTSRIVGIARLLPRWIPGLRFWPATSDTASDAPAPFVAIVGLHSSGSSAMAGVCWHLGIHLGKKFLGYYAVDQVHRGFEERGLFRLCEEAAPFPQTSINNPDRTQECLVKWINDRQREASKKKVLAGGKYPHLCRLGKQLQRACGENLLVIHCDRFLEESILSLQRREQKKADGCTPEAAEAVQRWLWAGKQEFLAEIPAERQLTVSFDYLLADAEQQARRIAEFLHIDPTAKQIRNAASLVKPKSRHVKL